MLKPNQWDIDKIKSSAPVFYRLAVAMNEASWEDVKNEIERQLDWTNHEISTKGVKYAD